MTESPQEPSSASQSALGREVGAKARRKLAARRHPTPGVWAGLGTMGLVGWSVVIPTLLGAALGVWLDRRYPGGRSWTLALLFVGLVLGCWNAWYWVAKEDEAMRDARENGDE